MVRLSVTQVPVPQSVASYSNVGRAARTCQVDAARGDTMWGIAVPGKHTLATYAAVAMQSTDARWQASMKCDDVCLHHSGCGAQQARVVCADEGIHNTTVARMLRRMLHDVLEHVMQRTTHVSFSAAGAYGYSYAGVLMLLDALRARGVLSAIKGYNGCSAGSLAALGFACGVSAQEMSTFITSLDVSRLLDEDVRLTRPVAESTVNSLIDGYVVAATLAHKKVAGGGARPEAAAAAATATAATAAAATTAEGAAAAAEAARSRQAAPVVPGNMCAAEKYAVPPLRCLPSGLLSGTFLTNFARAALQRWHGDADVTFHQLWAATGKELRIVATNLDLCLAHEFSHVTSPHLPVHLALRASMSVPAVFVPVEIDGTLYVDGGVVDAGPLNATCPQSTLTFRVCADVRRCERTAASIMKRITDTVTEYQYEFHKRWMHPANKPIIVPLRECASIRGTSYDATPRDRLAAIREGQYSVTLWLLAVKFCTCLVHAVILCARACARRRR